MSPSTCVIIYLLIIQNNIDNADKVVDIKVGVIPGQCHVVLTLGENKMATKQNVNIIKGTIHEYDNN